MPRIDFDALPEHGRMWVFPLKRRLAADEATAVLDVVDDFLNGWAAHGMPLRSGRRLVDDHFLLVGVDVDAEAPSGCSIDALVGQLRTLGARLGTTFVDHAPVWYRSTEGIRAVSRPDFKRLAAEGSVDVDTAVFDTSLTKMSEAALLERPAAESWHGRAFFQGSEQG